MSAASLYNTPMMFCAICQEEKAFATTVVVRLPCTHAFCLGCFSKSRVTSCAVCRQPYEANFQIPDEVIKQWKPQIKDIVVDLLDERERRDAAIRIATNRPVSNHVSRGSRSPPIQNNRSNNRGRNNQRGNNNRRRTRADDLDDPAYNRNPIQPLNTLDYLNYLIVQEEEADRQEDLLNLSILD